MIQGITTLCFAASYAVALALEITRLFLRSGLRGVLMIGFAAAGLLAQTLYLAHRAMVATTPLSSPYDWYLVAAWFLVAVYLFLTVTHPRNAIGLFLLPLVLALIAVATFMADRVPFPETRAAMWWGAVHGALLLIGSVAVMIGFVAGVMYLVQAYRLKHKLPPKRGFVLPSLEWLRRVNAWAIVVSVFMLALGVVSGIILNLVQHRLDREHVPWSDPIVWSSGLVVAWFIAVGIFGAVYRPALEGRKVAYLTVASFVFLVLAMGVSLLVETQHSGAAPEATSGTRGTGSFFGQLAFQSETTDPRKMCLSRNCRGGTGPFFGEDDLLSGKTLSEKWTCPLRSTPSIQEHSPGTGSFFGQSASPSNATPIRKMCLSPSIQEHRPGTGSFFGQLAPQSEITPIRKMCLSPSVYQWLPKIYAGRAS